MNKEFITYEQAFALKELGFDEPCFGSWEIDYCKVPTYTHSIRCFGSEFYKNSNHSKGKITAPLYQQAFRWFRDKKFSDGSVCRYGEADGGYLYRWDILHEYGIYEERHFKQGYKTYEEAEQACLDELIQIVKKSANK